MKLIYFGKMKRIKSIQILFGCYEKGLLCIKSFPALAEYMNVRLKTTNTVPTILIVRERPSKRATDCRCRPESRYIVNHS